MHFTAYMNVLWNIITNGQGENLDVEHNKRSNEEGEGTTGSEGKPVEIQEIKGTYKNQILTAEYWSTEKNEIERGTFTLRRATSDRLDGFFTFFSGDPLSLQQSKYIWKRLK